MIINTSLLQPRNLFVIACISLAAHILLVGVRGYLNTSSTQTSN